MSLYATTSTAWGGRDGRTASADGKLDLQLSIPKELGGDGGPGTNPEQLFATGYAACFHSALKLVARSQSVDVKDSAVSVTIGLTGSAAEGLTLTSKIEAQIPGLDRETAEKLLEAAHSVCPYSRATHGNIPSEVVLLDDED